MQKLDPTGDGQCILLNGVIIRPLRDDDIETSQRLRFEVWSAEGVALTHLKEHKIHDELDAQAFHWGAFVENDMVASARLTVHQSLNDAPDGYLFHTIELPTPVANLSRMVVGAQFRRLGVARAIDELRIRRAREMGAKVVIGSPVKTIPTLERLKSYGFQFTEIDGKADWGDTPITGAYMLLTITC